MRFATNRSSRCIESTIADPLDTPDVTEVELDDRPMLRTKPRSTNALTWILLGCVVAVGGFAVGVRVQKAKAPTTVAAGGGQSAGGVASSGFAAGGFSGRNGGGASAAAGATTVGATATGATPTTAVVAAGSTTGIVKLVDGAKIYIQDASGNVIKVTTSAGTAVAVASSASVAQIKAGDTVEVVGTTGADGFVAATSVQDKGPAATTVSAPATSTLRSP